MDIEEESSTPLKYAPNNAEGTLNNLQFEQTPF